MKIFAALVAAAAVAVAPVVTGVGIASAAPVETVQVKDGKTDWKGQVPHLYPYDPHYMLQKGIALSEIDPEGFKVFLLCCAIANSN